MSIKISVKQFKLAMRHVFTISRESLTHQHSIIVELKQGDICGYGEVSPNRYYGHSGESLIANMHAAADVLAATSLLETHPKDLWDALLKVPGMNPFALSAIDTAAYDLWGKLHNKPVYELLGMDASTNCQSDVTVGIDSVDVMVSKMKEFDGWPIFKIKLGTDNDLEIIKAIREHSDAVIRVDANCGWNLQQAIDLSREMEPLNVEFIEQAMPADKWDDMKVLKQESALPQIADESCIEEPDVERCNGYFHGVNVKLCKCGGITPALRMLYKAKELGMKCMVGSMVESTIAMSAIGHLVPLLDYVDMDGAQLLGEDIADGVVVDRGDIIYADTPGLGITPTDDYYAKGEEK